MIMTRAAGFFVVIWQLLLLSKARRDYRIVPENLTLGCLLG
jgi:hypothetical protein